MPKPERTAAILVAAGRGLRAGSGGPKQYRSIGGQTVIFRAMEPFCRHPQIFAVQPVLNPDDTAVFNEAVSALRYEPPANGGATRQASVHAGLEALAGHKPDVVLIHDAARPFVSAALSSGALADGDIGSHFPPSDPRWKGAASDRFLKYAVDRVTARGGRIANLEVTLICERPKIGPLRDTMRARIAGITGVK